ncbi:predicted protein [Nematostella vectensis]|uniref:Mannose-6-phosphate isomerase n=1 Tax=Nematostella vectensis TaxID=45351 RepID=A7SEE9_NEMVE|nr:predicted protein [Nematostella vectensis]|eukprot:XP_001630002.1 predicted protein [Nematostella vectensis]
MGTHPNGPSTICGNDGTSLSEWIYRHNGCLGNKVTEMFSGKLPFLFKVLSVNKSLSIQAHPNKHHAEQLHAARPDIYKDPNHKPEMAIAITDYEGLCGFRPVSEIKEFLQSVPELASVIGEQPCALLLGSNDKASECEGIKQCFSSLMTRDEIAVTKHLSELLDRIKTMKSAEIDVTGCLGDLFLSLHGQFPGDVGCFCIYFLNHVMLKPGQAMFLGPNLPHAYLSGDCMECMACSDNVVRAGLTPKYKDVQTLCDMLDYSPGTAEDNIFPSQLDPEDSHVVVYDPPVKDFSVARINLPASLSSYTVKAVEGPSILIVISGGGETLTQQPLKLERGAVLFMPASVELPVKTGNEGLLVFRAYCDPK